MMLNNLNERLAQAIERGLTEGMKRARRSIYTIDATYIESETPVDDMSIAATFYDEEEAIDAARQFAKDMIDADEVVITYVYSGQYETPNGDVFGEPEAFYSISNRDKEETAEVMKSVGFISSECDEYATDYLENDI